MVARSGLITTAALVAFAIQAAGRAEEVTLDAEADTYIYMASPEENFGRSAFLRARDNPASAIKAYIRFDVSGITDRSKVTTVVLSLSAYSDGAWLNQGFSIFGLVDGHAGEAWVEGNGGKDATPADEVTWNNAPANAADSSWNFTDDATPLGDFKPEAGAKGYQPFTSEKLLAFVKADTDGKITLMIGTSGSAIQSIDARARPNPPRLEVTHAAE